MLDRQFTNLTSWVDELLSAVMSVTRICRTIMGIVQSKFHHCIALDGPYNSSFGSGTIGRSVPSEKSRKVTFGSGRFSFICGPEDTSDRVGPKRLLIEQVNGYSTMSNYMRFSEILSQLRPMKCVVTPFPFAIFKACLQWKNGSNRAGRKRSKEQHEKSNRTV